MTGLVTAESNSSAFVNQNSRMNIAGPGIKIDTDTDQLHDIKCVSF